MSTQPYDSTQDTQAHIARVANLLGQVSANLMMRAQVHDASKLESPEKEIFDQVTPKLKALTYGSDEYKAQLTGMKVALEHHYACNGHHPENRRANEEQWKDVVGWEGKYQVSNFGDIRSVERLVQKSSGVSQPVAGKLLKPFANHQGRLIATFGGNIREKRSVHRLVATAFIPNPDNKPEINHKNGDSQDNYWRNLEWVTRQENVDHAVENGLYVGAPPKHVVYCEELNLLTLGTSQMEAELIKRGHTTASQGNIYECMSGKRKSHLGFHFEGWKIEEFTPKSDLRFMSLLDLVELLIDWKAAGERHADGSIERSLTVNKERFAISDQLASILRNTCIELGWIKP